MPQSSDQSPRPRGARPTIRPPTLAEQLASVALEAFLQQLPPDIRAAVEVALPDEGKVSPWARVEGEVAEAIDSRLRARLEGLLEGMEQRRPQSST